MTKTMTDEQFHNISMAIKDFVPYDEIGMSIRQIIKDVEKRRDTAVNPFPLTDKEFVHLALRLNSCRCGYCQEISRKLYNMKNEARKK